MTFRHDPILLETSFRCPPHSCCGIVLGGDRRAAWRAGRPMRLGRIEYGLLELLLANRGMIFTRKTLIDILWDTHQSIDLRTVDVHVARLRRALTLRCAPNPIHTVRSHGYTIQETCEEGYQQWLRRPTKLRLRQAPIESFEEEQASGRGTSRAG